MTLYECDIAIIGVGMGGVAAALAAAQAGVRVILTEATGWAVNDQPGRFSFWRACFDRVVWHWVFYIGCRLKHPMILLMTVAAILDYA